MSYYTGKVPEVYKAKDFTFRPLLPKYAQLDYDAIVASKEELQRWGFDEIKPDFTVEDNRAGVQQHADELAERIGYAYTILNAAEDMAVGCLYNYGMRYMMERFNLDEDVINQVDSASTSVRFWTRADKLDDEARMLDTIIEWLDKEWEFPKVYYASHEFYERHNKLYESRGMVKCFTWKGKDRNWFQYHLKD